MSKQDRSDDGTQQELGQGQLDHVIGGVSGEFWNWRKKVEDGSSDEGSFILPRIGWEVDVSY